MTERPTEPMPAILAEAAIDGAVRQLSHQYQALLIVVTGVRGGPSDQFSEAILGQAEQRARAQLAGAPPDTLPEVAAWREAFFSFGVKPRQARSSVEALLRRVDGGLPRIDRLTDIYNAVSIDPLIPIGGESSEGYRGAPRLVRATGDEPFDTIVDGEPTSVTAETGEVVWRDDVGVTCRRWNWRQCVRTRLTNSTTDVLFILDALPPITTDRLEAAGSALIDRVTVDSPSAQVSSRLLGDSR